MAVACGQGRPLYVLDLTTSRLSSLVSGPGAEWGFPSLPFQMKQAIHLGRFKHAFRC
jgi:hypothetical protein